MNQQDNYQKPVFPVIYKVFRLERQGKLRDVHVYRRAHGEYYNGSWKDDAGVIYTGIVTYEELNEIGGKSE